MTGSFRVEQDCLGRMEISNDCYFGIQTHRMLNVSGVSGLPIVFYPDILRAMAKIKKAAALANAEVGALDRSVAQAIAQASDRVYSGEFDDQFPLDMWQGGGYTCFNMNVNEVIGNLANEILTGHKGQEKVHPNTHVNMGQSTNDTIPSATHLAIVPRLDKLTQRLEELKASLNQKAIEFSSIVKVGRTCWQDALPLTLGQEFSGYASLINRLIQKAKQIRPQCLEIIMGGSAVGTGLSAAPGYMDAFYKILSQELNEEVKPFDNLFDGFQNADTIVSISGIVKEIAASLSKISKDLRLMSSGPRAGFMEISLPSLSPGSSIMPGKINPTVPEMVVQVAHQVIGNDLAITLALEEGELDLQVWDATLYKCLFENLQIVTESILILRRDCIDGIVANKERCLKEAEDSIALSTVIATIFGYPKGVEVAKYCETHQCSVKEAVLEMNLMSKDDVRVLLEPALMTDPQKMARTIKQFTNKN